MALKRFIQFAKKPRCYLLSSRLGVWFETDLGRAIQDVEAEIANHIMPTRFGYHLLYSGQGDPDKLLDKSPISHKFIADDAPHARSWLPFVYGESGALPLANECIDLVVLQQLRFRRKSAPGASRSSAGFGTRRHSDGYWV